MRDRTADLLRARQALSQLSYSPISVLNLMSRDQQDDVYRIDAKLVGLSGLEPPTSPLSGVRSNQLSYKPTFSLATVLFFILQSDNSCGHFTGITWRCRLRR